MAKREWALPVDLVRADGAPTVEFSERYCLARRGPAMLVVGLIVGLIVLVALLGVVLLRPVLGVAQEASRPDVVLILTDDQPHHTVRFMPLVDSLIGRDAVRFTNHFAHVALCAPSRVTALTGLYSHNHGATGNSNGMEFDDTSTLATWLQPAGYRTALIGKYLNGYAKRPGYIPPGWSTWKAFLRPRYYDFQLVERRGIFSYPRPYYSTDVLTGKAVRFIEATPRHRPLFLLYAPYAPHVPAKPAPADEGLFEGIDPYRPPSYDEPDVSDKPAWVRDLPPLTPSHHTYLANLLENEAESLQAVDRGAAAIVDALARTGRLENAVIVFTSDNGYSLGAHRWKKKQCPYDECVRQPLLMRIPGVEPRDEDAVVSNVDLAPTLSELAGVDPPPTNGRSLVPLLTGQATEWRDGVLIEQLGDVELLRMFHAIRTRRHLYVEYVNGEREFYDVEADPWQLVNSAYSPQNFLTVAVLALRLAVLKSDPPR